MCQTFNLYKPITQKHETQRKTIGEKWATFQSLNFGSASQPFYLLISSNGTLLNNPVQYTTAQIYKDWLKEGIRKFKSIQ